MHFLGTEIGNSLPGWLAYLLFNNGGNGVTVFFAVSGFLITLTSVRRFGSPDRLRDDSLPALGTCLVMVATALRGGRGNRLMAPVRWFGRHSYEVYLTHEFVVVGGTALSVHVHSRGQSFFGLPGYCCFQHPLARFLPATSPSR